MKRFLSVVLSVMMIMSTMTFPVLAATEVADGAALKAAVEAGGEAKLTGDIILTETLTISTGKIVTIDLGGHTITGTMHKGDGAVIKNLGTLTLKNGTVSSTANNGGSALLNEGLATVADVTLNGAPNADGSWPSYTVNNIGELTIEDSMITSYHGAVSSYADGAIVNLNDTNIDMIGIPGFTSHAIYTYNNGTVIVNGGNIANNAADQSASGGSVINGHVIVKSGNFTGCIQNYYGTPEISGGKFVNVDGTALVVNSAFLKNAECDDKGNVVSYVAKVGTEYYTDFNEAVSAAKTSSNTLNLLADITVEATNGGYKKAGITQIGFDIDGNGHTLNVTGAGGTWDCAIYTRGGTISNITIASGFRGVFTAGQDADIILDNVTIDGPTYTISADDGNKAHDFIIRNSTLNGWTSYTDKFASVTFENCKFGEGAGYAYCRPYQSTVFKNCDFEEDYGFDGSIAADVKFDDCTIGGEPLTADNAADLFGSSVEASIGDVYYKTLEDAFAVASDGDTIVLAKDATPALTSQRKITKASVIDLNGKTLKLAEDDLYFGTTTFKDGNIVVDPSVKASTAVLWMFENQTLTLDNVKLTATGVKGTYLIGNNGGTGSAINLLNGTSIIVDNDATTGLGTIIADNGTGNSVTIKDSYINVKNIDGRFYLGGKDGSVSIENSTLALDGVKEGFYLRAGQDLAIEGTSDVNVKLNDTKGRYGINITDATANYSVADTSIVNASIYRAPAADGSNLADTVNLAFEPTDNQNVYNIYVEATKPGQTINRLSAVQLKFELKSDTNMSYTLAPVKGVSLTNAIDEAGIDTKVEDIYVFNFTGENGVADMTGAKIQIGTVTFGGYGKFDFKVVASEGNYTAKAKTAEATDNIIAEYVPVVENAKQGLFDLDASALTGAEVVEVRRDVVVNIAFNNNLKDSAANIADYNQMKVTLTGSNGKTYESEVCFDGANVTSYTNEQATLTFSVEANTRYTVTVSGAGYRTVRYTTLVDESDEALELNFWNNALENADRTERTEEIEAGVARSAKSVTFLAGDISPDNTIDKYDLAAVVSYFGYDNLKSDAKYYGFAKYDLNRDGHIDADDIATVLISWGK